LDAGQFQLLDFKSMRGHFNAIESNKSFICHFLYFITVPIIPEFLYDIRHPDAPLSSFPNEPPSPPPVTLAADGSVDPDYTTIGYGNKKTFHFL
jgi:hypothetical protein